MKFQWRVSLFLNVHYINWITVLHLATVVDNIKNGASDWRLMMMTAANINNKLLQLNYDKNSTFSLVKRVF